MRDRHWASLVAAGVLLWAGTAGAQRTSLDARAISTWARLLAVHDARSADTAVVDEALASPVAPLRAAAARVIGLNRLASRYATLRARLVSERDTAARRDAAFALGLAADTASCSALRTALVTPDAAEAAAWALGEMGDPCGAFDALHDAAVTPAARAALLRAAGKWTPFPDVAVLSAYRTARMRDERWAALYVLGRSRQAAGAPLAIPASRDGDAGIREVAARLMAANIQPMDTARRAVLMRLEVLSRDSAPHVRIAAVRALATHGAGTLASLDATFRHERDANVRVALAQVLASVADSASSTWAAWWSADTTHMVRRSLIAGAWQVGAVSLLPGAASLGVDPDPRLRIAMLEGSAARNAAVAVPVASRALSDADPRVRTAAFRALMRTTGALRDSLLGANTPALLADADVGVREAVLAARERSASASDVPLALGAYERARADASAAAREAALLVVASAWRRDSLAFDSVTIARLRGLEADVSARIWPRVAVIPGSTWDPRNAPDTTRARYEAIVRRIIVPSLHGQAPQFVLGTARGVVRITLDGVQTPMTIDHFSRLAARSYFSAMQFHRVVPAFVAQTGDPRGDGGGGPGSSIRDELNRNWYRRSAVGMALSGPDTGGSQFFLTLAPQPHLDGHYTVFGHVTAGFAAMDALVQGDRLQSLRSTLP